MPTTWLAVYPTITLVQELLGKSMTSLPLPLRTLIVTTLVVPVVTYLVMPHLARVEQRLSDALAARRMAAHRA